MSMMDMIEEEHRIALLIESRAHELSVEAFASATKFPEEHRRADYAAIFIKSVLESSRERAKEEIEKQLCDEVEGSTNETK